MKPSTDHIDIDKYLRNELSGSELKAFESKLDSDPALKEQVDFDQLVAEGLKNVRKAELKARLDAIDVTSPFSSGHFTNNFLIKTVGTVVTASIVGIGAYFYFSDHNSDVQYLDGYSDHPQNLDYAEVDANEISEALNLYEEESSKVNVVEEAKTVVLENTAVEKVAVEPSFSPQVAVPTLGDLEEENHSNNDINFEAPQNTELKVTEPLAGEVIDVVFEKLEKENSLQYKYFDGKLFLYGDFQGIPYELLEINRSAQKLVYLYHNEVYYQIGPSDEVQDLEPINESSLLDELEILRNNKP